VQRRHLAEIRILEINFAPRCQ